MATNTIALKLTLDGSDVAINNIKELEQALKLATDKLKVLGSGAEFDKLKVQIRQGQNYLKQFNEELEGKSVEQRIGDYAKLGSAITSSFAGAQAAVQLFGDKSEGVAEAAAKAQNILTLALVGREVAEGAVTIKSIANSIATKAEAAATNSANGATKAFYTTLAANPYGAIIAAVGVLIGLFISLEGETEKQATALEKLTLRQNQFLQAVSNENAEIQRTMELAVARAELEGKTAAQIKTIREDALNQQLFNIAQELDIFTRSYETRRKAALDAARKEKKDLKQAEAEFQLEDKKQKDAYNQQLYEGDKNVKLLQINLDKQLNAERDKLRTDQQQKDLAALRAKLALQKQEIEALADYNKADAEVNAEVVDRAKKLQTEVLDLIKKRTEFFDGLTDDEVKLGQDLEDLLFKIVPTGEQLKTIQDDFLTAFYFLSNSIKKGSKAVLNEQGKLIEFSLENIQKVLNENEFKINLDSLTKEAQKSLVQFYTRLSKTAEIYGKGVKIADVLVGTPKDKKDAVKSLTDLTQQTIDILNNPSILPGLQNNAIRKAVEGLFDFPKKTAKDFVGTLEEQQLQLEEYNADIKIAKQNLVEFALTQAQFQMKTDDVAKALKEETIKLLELRNGLVEVKMDINNIATAIGDGANKFKLSTQEMEVFTESMVDRIKKQPELLETFFKEVSLRSNEFLIRFGEDGLKTLFSKIGEAIAGTKDLTKEEIDKLLLLLKNAAGTIKTEYGTELGKSLDPAADKLTKAGKKIQEAITLSGFTETIKKVQTDIEAFQSVLTSLSQYTSDYYNFQLTALEKRNEKIQKTIIGDTKQAADLRLETEKQYQLEKEKLEKQAAKRTLQITLAQAIANTAAALIKVTEQTGVFATLAAGIVAGINAKQIFLIQSQIAALDSYQRGGIVKAAGGLITGPSHEFGGVMLGNGVNAEGGESIINRQSTIKYGSLLSQINQSGGGKPLVNNFDDSRIVEALAKQKSEPIRAYVIEQDISSKQAVSRRLQELSRI